MRVSWARAGRGAPAEDVCASRFGSWRCSSSFSSAVRSRRPRNGAPSSSSASSAAPASAPPAGGEAKTRIPTRACRRLPRSSRSRRRNRPLKIGATLHPYFSWTKNVVGDAPGVEVRSILPGDVDAGDYQPSPKDIQKLSDLDALVVNGIGHDDFIGAMIKASGNTKLVVIRANEGTRHGQERPRRRAELAHLHLVHQRHSTDADDRKDARRAPSRSGGVIRQERRGVRGEAPQAPRRRGREASPRREGEARRHRPRWLCVLLPGVRRRRRRRRPARARPRLPSANELGEMVDLL